MNDGENRVPDSRILTTLKVFCPSKNFDVLMESKFPKLQPPSAPPDSVARAKNL